VLTKIAELIVRRLVGGADPRVHRNPASGRLADGLRGALSDLRDVIEAPSVGEREVRPVLTDNDVIENGNPEEFSGSNKTLRDRIVLGAR
jgi:hypothetical protein